MNHKLSQSAWILDHYCRRGTKSRPHAGGQTHTWRWTLVGELAASPTHPEAKNTLCALHVHTHTRPYLFHRPPLRPLMPPCWIASPNHYTDAKKSCDSRRFLLPALRSQLGVTNDLQGAGFGERVFTGEQMMRIMLDLGLTRATKEGLTCE